MEIAKLDATVGIENEGTEAGHTRRQVLKGAVCAGAILALPALRAGAAAPDQWTVAGKADQFVKDTPKKVDINGQTFYVTRTSDTELKAVWAHCTHRGCTVAWDATAKQLACPCHGAAFGSDGANIHGTRGNPSEKLKSLANIPTRVNAGNVELNLAPQP